jgi:cytoskeletal protein RodZ
VGAATTFDKVLSAAKNPFVLLGLVGIVILLGLLLVRRVRARDEPPEATPRPTKTRQQVPQQRTPEERRRMHEERMRRRRQRLERDEGTR